MQRTIGNIKVTSIVEQNIDLSYLFPGATREVVRSINWLIPDFADSDGNITAIIQSFIVETADVKILVDTCIGNDKTHLHNERWYKQKFDFLEKMEKAGYPPESIDMVICTHLHIDHVGWNTIWDGIKWIPTFPNARYIFPEEEYKALTRFIRTEPLLVENATSKIDKLKAISDRSIRIIFAESIQPVVDSGLMQLTGSDQQVCEGVGLVPSPGHTPGHVAVLLSSGDREAIITGDALHHPVQIARPEIGCRIDTSSEASHKTRRKLLEEAEERQCLVIGSHFSGSKAGYIEKHNGTYRLLVDEG